VVGSEDFKPLFKLVGELVLQIIPELVKQTLRSILFIRAGSSSRTATNDDGFLSMSISCVLKKGVCCFVDFQAAFIL
jgi:hypothetical protein